MTRKFPNIEYKLSCDIIRYNKEIESLKNHSLNLCLGKIVKKSLKRKWFKRFSDDKRLCLKYYKEWRKNENSWFENFKVEFVQYLELDQYLIKEKIHFIGMQLVNFLLKYPYSPFLTAKEFLSHVAFTSQGTINTLKSVERVSKSVSMTPAQHFRLKCYLFSESYKSDYEGLPKNVKVNIYSIKKRDDFLKLCLNKTDDSFSPQTSNENFLYAYSNNLEKLFIKAIETNNEIAVEKLWTIKISQMKGGRDILGKVLKKFVYHSLKTSITMFLLLQVNENEFEDFFLSYSFKVIEKIIKEARWHCVFQKIFDVLKIYLNSDFISRIFSTLTDFHRTGYPTCMNLDLVVNYFSLLPVSDKIYILRESTRYSTNSLPSSTEKDKSPYERVISMSLDRKDYLEKLLEVGDDEELMNFFISCPRFRLDSEIVISGKRNSAFNALKRVCSKKALSDIQERF